MRHLKIIPVALASATACAVRRYIMALRGFHSNNRSSTPINIEASGAANVADIPAEAPATSSVRRSMLVKWKNCAINDPKAPPVMQFNEHFSPVLDVVPSRNRSLFHEPSTNSTVLWGRRQSRWDNAETVGLVPSGSPLIASSSWCCWGSIRPDRAASSLKRRY